MELLDKVFCKCQVKFDVIQDIFLLSFIYFYPVLVGIIKSGV